MMKSKKNSIFKLDMLLLLFLKRKSYYGYELVNSINEETNGLFNLQEGVLYPILSRLERLNLITSSEQVVNRKLRIYYQITEAGVKELEELKNDFTKKVKIIEEILLRGDNHDKQ